MKSIVIFGLGYTTSYLINSQTLENFQIYVVTRNPDQRNVPAHVQLLPFHAKDSAAFIKQADGLLSTVPPKSEGTDPVLEHYAEDILQAKPAWIGYLSSTGVYGDHGGEWVTETSDCHPSGIRNHHRLLAEKQWRSLSLDANLPIHVFRLSGIYGPRRNILDRITSGKSRCVYKPDHFFSRVHVEDIVKAVTLSMNSPTPGEIYNLADDKPAPLHEIYRYAARIMRLPPPELIPFEHAEMSEMMREFFCANKKISNQKIKEKLSLNLKYPSYKEGLQFGCGMNFHQ